MKLTCLSEGNGFYNTPCHIVQLCGFSLLFECPIDLSSLINFSPFPIVDSASSSSYNNHSDKLIRAAPWYKTILSLQQWDPNVIDIVFISSPYALLGLPFLTRKPGFSKSTKIYATEATIRIGHLMMEDIVSMHMEYVKYYGPEKGLPDWMNRVKLDPFQELDSWMPLYSEADIKDCIEKIQPLKFGEEVSFNGMLVIKALSSGLDIGCCNWSLKSPKTTIAYISSSLFGSACAMEFDYISLSGHDLVIFSDSLDLNSMNCEDECTMSGENEDGTSTELTASDEIDEETEKMQFICSCIVDSIQAGGSVLVPLGRLAIVLELLEHISDSLDSLNIKVPIYIISEKAEEMLTFTNAVPEWLCKQRQQKLFAGEALFQHVALIKEGKIGLHPAIYSSDLLAKWKEPCIVISPHWSLRFGAVIPLLHCWHADPNSLLILEEGVDAELALLPFQPVEMKVLQCSFLSRIKIRKLCVLLEELRPKTVLLPESLRAQYLIKQHTSYSFLYYSQRNTTSIPSLKKEYDAYLDTALAFQLQPTKLPENKIAIAKLKGRILLRNGVYLLTSINKPLNEPNKRVLYWGNVDPTRLMKALEERGIVGSVPDNECTGGFDFSIVLSEPKEGLVQARGNRIVISCLDEQVSVLICQAVSSICNGI